MRIDSSGRILAGLTSSNETNERLNITHPSDYVDNIITFSTQPANTVGNANILKFRDKGGVSAQIKACGSAFGGGNDNALQFYTSTSSNNAPTLALTINESQNATFAGTITDGKGKTLRQIPASGKSSQYTLTASDSGTVVYNSSGGWIIPNNTLDEGDTVSLLNNSGSDQTITASALGTALYNTADGVNIKASTITLGARAMATVYFISPTIAFIQASALTVS
jgi:hypothetical protein